MHVTICSACWKRQDLASAWWKGVHRVQARFQQAGVDTRVVVGGSEWYHQRMALFNEAWWRQVDNEPLGRKWNEIVSTACRFGTDYVLIIGSDDFLSDAVVDEYIELIKAEWMYIGLRGIYFFEPISNRVMIYNRPHRKYGIPIGAGRLVHESILRRTNYRPWDDERDRALDANFTKRLGLPAATLIQTGPNLSAVDVKFEVNMWTFDVLQERYPGLHEVAAPVGIPEWDEIASLGDPNAYQRVSGPVRLSGWFLSGVEVRP